jgi:hypothetical protein
MSANGGNLGHVRVRRAGRNWSPIGGIRVLGSEVFRTNPVTQGQAADHATRRRALHHKLPKAEHDAKEWQAAMEALLLVAELNGPTMFPQIGIMRALNRHVERVFDSSRKIIIGHGGSWRGIGDSHGLNVPLPW